MLKTLFKRNVNGTINQWTIIAEEDGYWTEYGQVGGVITKSDKVLVTPKNIGKANATTIAEQSLKEATSIWKKKIKSDNFVENIEDVDKKAFNPPMLAHAYEGEYTPNIKFIQPKLDGIRCNMHWENGKVVALSRTNHPFYSVEHIKESIKHILEEHPSLHLDGELYNHLLHDDFNKIANTLKNFKFKVLSNTGFLNSQVSAGGIATSEFSNTTLMSKRYKGLFVVGELLDIDGDCGGFNLSWAFASGMLAAESAVKQL